MNRLSAFLLSFALTFGSMAYASTATIQKGDVLQGFDNVLTNSSLDYPTVTLGWTSGTGVTPSADTTNYLDGKQSVSLSLSSAANATSLFYQDVTPGQGFSSVNLEAGMWVKTSVVGLQVCPRQAGAVLTGQCNSVPATGTWQPVSANMIGPASGSIGVALYNNSGSAATGTVNVDTAYVGRARNLSQVSQAKLLGTVTISGCTTFWSTTSTTFADVGVQTSCTYATTGTAQAPATMLPAIKFPSIPAGDVQFVFQGVLGDATTGKNATFQFWDGTNSARESSATGGSGGSSFGPGIVQTINYTTPQSNVTFSLRAKTDAAGTAEIFGTAAFPATIQVWYFPSQSQLTYQANLAPSYAATSVSAGTATANTTTGSWAAVTTVSTRVNYGSATTPATAGQYATTIPYLPAGLYLAVVHGSMQCSVSTGAPVNSGFFRLFDGTSDGGSSQQINSSVNSVATYVSEISGIYNYTSPQTNITYTLQSQPATNGSCGLSIGAAQTAQITLIPLSQGVTTPSYVGSVQSNTSGQERVERAYITSTTCAASSQSGSWISSSVHNSTGVCTHTLAAGIFSGAPVCTCSTRQASGNFVCFFNGSAPSTTSITTTTYSIGGGAVTDTDVMLMCMGPR